LRKELVTLTLVVAVTLAASAALVVARTLGTL
jgi:hypothetical protein